MSHILGIASGGSFALNLGTVNALAVLVAEGVAHKVKSLIIKGALSDCDVAVCKFLDTGGERFSCSVPAFLLCIGKTCNNGICPVGAVVKVVVISLVSGVFTAAQGTSGTALLYDYHRCDNAGIYIVFL